MKTYELEFDVDALKEWHKLGGSVKVQFKKQLSKRLLEPHVPSARLHGDLQNTYKIKHQRCWLPAGLRGHRASTGDQGDCSGKA